MPCSQQRGPILLTSPTRERLLDAAYRILSEESFSQLSIDRVTERAGLSRRTFFLHFKSKDQLLAEVLAYLRPAQAAIYRRWSDQLDPRLGTEERILALVGKLVEMIRAPGWHGCCFMRLSAELGDRAGHPVHAVVAEAHHDMERWLESELARGSYAAPGLTARQLVILINGMLLMQLVHRDDSYSSAVLAMLPAILASAREAEPQLPKSAVMLACTG